MTDFFADLESELRRAHARNERGVLGVLRGIGLRRPAVMHFAALTATVAVAASVVGLVLTGAPPERDVAAPASADPCAATAPPPEIEQAFSVLERPAEPRDELPRELREGLARHAPEGWRLLWLEHARHARGDGERSYYVVPGLLGGTCEAEAETTATGDPRPAVCVLAAAPYADVPACATVAQVEEAGLLLFAVPLPEEKWRTSVLVADGAEPGLLVGGERVEGDVEGNVFVARYEATMEEQEAMEIDVDRQALHSPDAQAAP